jgi:hypothetical protein
MTRQMDNREVIEVIGQLLEVLNEPDPDPFLFQILETLPLNTGNVTRILSALAVRAGGMTLQAAGVDDDHTARVSLVFKIPADDISDHCKTAADLVRLACDFLLAAAPVDDTAVDEPARVLNEAVATVVARGSEHAFLVLGEVLGHIRRLLVGDTRGVIRG